MRTQMPRALERKSDFVRVNIFLKAALWIHIHITAARMLVHNVEQSLRSVRYRKQHLLFELLK